MLTVVGRDQPGIVARISTALYKGGCNLGEASMIRLGGNFTIMLMVQFDGSSEQLTRLVSPEADSLGLQLHADLIEGSLHQHLEPDVFITLYGADRSGIVAQATTALADAGLHILNLESDVAGSEQKPIYIMNIEGHSARGIQALKDALSQLSKEGIEAHLTPTDTMIG